jgi:uncharacterized protein YjbI with pentapeptide repeats
MAAPAQTPSLEVGKFLQDHKEWLDSGGKTGNRATTERLRLIPPEQLKTGLCDGDLTRADLHECCFKGISLRGTDLRGAILRAADLREASGLLASQLAGADISGGCLPENSWLRDADAASTSARKLFFVLLGAVFYCWLILLNISDPALFSNTPTTLIAFLNGGVTVPVVTFSWASGLILLGLYVYFHVSLQRYWDRAAGLPATFPDGREPHKCLYPWALSTMLLCHRWRGAVAKPRMPLFVQVRHFVKSLPSRVREAIQGILSTPAVPLLRTQHGFTILLAWVLVPYLLFRFWLRCLLLHRPPVTAIQVAVFSIATVFGFASFRLAVRTLRGGPQAPAEPLRIILRPLWLLIPAVPCLLVSLVVMERALVPDGPVHNALAPIAALAQRLGIRSRADLNEAVLSGRPAQWTGDQEKDFDLVKPVRLAARSMDDSLLRAAFLVRADLRGTGLQSADLAYADLRRAVLSHADLQGANLTEARLEGARFDISDEADGRLPWLYQPLSKRTSLNSANLQQAHLRDSHLEGVDFTSADLRGADLCGATFEFEQIRAARNWILAKGCEMPPIDENPKSTGLKQPRLIPAHRSRPGEVKSLFTLPLGADYADHNARLRAVPRNFRGYNLHDMRLQESDLSGVDFRNANLAGADFSKANLRGVDFGEAKVQGAYFDLADVKGADFTHTTDFEIANVGSAKNWVLAKFSADQIRLSKPHRLESDHNARLGSCNLTRYHLADTNLAGTDFSGCDLSHADLKHANLQGVCFEGAILSETDLEGVDLSGVQGLKKEQILGAKGAGKPPLYVKCTGTDLPAGGTTTPLTFSPE